MTDTQRPIAAPVEPVGRPHTPTGHRLPRGGRKLSEIDGYGTCAKCRAEWTGFTVAHCAACHRTFTGPSAFDLHRTGSHANSTRRCLDPATVTDKYGNNLLEPVHRRYWSGWGWRGDDNRWEGR